MEKERKRRIFQNPTEAKKDYELRDLAQGKTERHNFKGNLESNFSKCMGCEPSTQAWVLASGSSVCLPTKLWLGPPWLPTEPQHTSITHSLADFFSPSLLSSMN